MDKKASIGSDSKASQDTRKDQREQYQYLDGIRGVAAYFVFYHHVYNVFMKYSETDPNYYNPIINISTNGNLWVMVFFLISGFVVPLNYMKSPEKDL